LKRNQRGRRRAQSFFLAAGRNELMAKDAMNTGE
jgi:hypothetical protein